MIATTGFVIGLLGSVHCLAMCGPIAMALPVRTNNIYVKITKYLVYNMGRSITYAILGLLIGIGGQSLIFNGMQELFSVLSGILILLTVVFVYQLSSLSPLRKYSAWIREQLKSSLQFYLKRTGVWAMFMIGLLNGLLPCSMVYVALVVAMSMGNTWSSAWMMFSFGLGTIPMMLSVAVFSQKISQSVRAKFHYITPIMAVVVAVILICRGINHYHTHQMSSASKSCVGININP